MTSKLPSVAEDEARLEAALLERLATRLEARLVRLDETSRRVLSESANAAVDAALERIQQIAAESKLGRIRVAPSIIESCSVTNFSSRFSSTKFGISAKVSSNLESIKL